MQSWWGEAATRPGTALAGPLLHKLLRPVLTKGVREDAGSGSGTELHGFSSPMRLTSHTKFCF